MIQANDEHIISHLNQLSHEHKVREEIEASQAPYRGGEHTTVWQDWEPHNLSGDDAIGFGQQLMNARVHDLFRNEPIIRNIRRQMTKGVIGTGINVNADVLDDDNESYEDAFNFESDDLFERWADEEADVDGKLSWYDMQKIHFEGIQDNGENLLLECADNSPGRTVPLCYQVIEKDQLDETKDWPADNNGVKCIRGIEYLKNKPIAFWLFDAHPADSHSGWSSESTRVPAQRVKHSFLPNRPSENRGVTWFSGNIQYAKDMDWYLTTELSSAALGAGLAIYVKSKNKTNQNLIGGRGNGTDRNGLPVMKMGKANVVSLNEDDDVGTVESSRPNRDADPFINLLLQLHGMAYGLSKLRVTGDYNQTSYTAARGAHLDDSSYFKILQGWAARSFVRPVRKKFTIQAASFGRFASISPRQFRNHQHQFTRVCTLAPGREQLDPEKETGAAKDRIGSLLSNHQIECGLRGLDWRRVALQQKREKAFYKKHNLDPDLDHSAAFLARRAEERAKEAGEANATSTQE